MPRAIGFVTVKRHGQNVNLIEGARGMQADNGQVTVHPVADGHPWTLDVPVPGSLVDLAGLFDGTIDKLAGTYSCTASPTQANGMTATLAPHPV